MAKSATRCQFSASGKCLPVAIAPPVASPPPVGNAACSQRPLRGKPALLPRSPKSPGTRGATNIRSTRCHNLHRIKSRRICNHPKNGTKNVNDRIEHLPAPTASITTIPVITTLRITRADAPPAVTRAMPTSGRCDPTAGLEFSGSVRTDADDRHHAAGLAELGAMREEARGIAGSAAVNYADVLPAQASVFQLAAIGFNQVEMNLPLEIAVTRQDDESVQRDVLEIAGRLVIACKVLVLFLSFPRRGCRDHGQE